MRDKRMFVYHLCAEARARARQNNPTVLLLAHHRPAVFHAVEGALSNRKTAHDDSTRRTCKACRADSAVVPIKLYGGADAAGEAQDE
jgi:hypothetical protein